MPYPAAFFDRDNTLIEDRIYLNDPNDIHYLPGVFDSLHRVQNAGYKIIVVTNQSGIPRGLVELHNLHEIHRRIRADFALNGVHIDGFYYAPFLPKSGHPMRKPGTGMLVEAAFDHNIDLSQSWMVGDRMTDVEAGHRAGCQSIFLEGTEPHETSIYAAAEFVAKTLPEVADFILSQS